MTKQTINRILLAVLVVSNVYLIYRVNANTMSIAAYDAGISQRNGVGKLESFWTKYIGGSKNNRSTYEDRRNAEADSQTTINILIILDVVLVSALYMVNKKPKLAPVKKVTNDSKSSRSSGRRR